jgi:KaiC/GvpD/RAD55 family RecA-like ATPase
MKINFTELEHNELILIIVPNEKVDEVNMDILEHFVKEKEAICIYTTFTKPYKVILKNLKKNAIDSNKIFFIDCATPVSGPTEISGTNKVIFCQPQSLTNLSIAVTTALQNMPQSKNRILILDTITTLMLYNDKNDVIKFIHHLCGQIRKYGVKSLIFTLDEESDEKIIAEISRFCDASFKLSQLIK